VPNNQGQQDRSGAGDSWDCLEKKRNQQEKQGNTKEVLTTSSTKINTDELTRKQYTGEKSTHLTKSSVNAKPERQ